MDRNTFIPSYGFEVVLTRVLEGFETGLENTSIGLASLRDSKEL
jgi:hypothetical protein